MTLVTNLLRNFFRKHFAKFMSGSDIVFSVNVSMQLCVLKYVLDRFTGIVGTGIEDNVVINENIQK